MKSWTPPESTVAAWHQGQQRSEFREFWASDYEREGYADSMTLLYGPRAGKAVRSALRKLADPTSTPRRPPMVAVIGRRLDPVPTINGKPIGKRKKKRKPPRYDPLADALFTGKTIDAHVYEATGQVVYKSRRNPVEAAEFADYCERAGAPAAVIEAARLGEYAAAGRAVTKAARPRTPASPAIAHYAAHGNQAALALLTRGD